ncbi:glucose-6-phosphate dehydrogenase assembly protein OpcA [Kocuria turfanensis]|uniref:Glucose-6-phosphate dehydrogenase assembly protein OpcA n=1 Tax=Kocuria turfanensis TaxID=388357 RepID=A0A512IDM8_9MICC|nr:glucose-6-phosphate dehydrogenase assembly protein OpcA [Kocuria turfanensis]GEO95804.1 glucose-6-phosphate dehydrogenase assembly protein OpcA [Kocuria turfanensis]
MIVSMENTTTSAIDKKLNQLRDQHGVVTLGRVLTLVILAQAGHSEAALEAANFASHEHPCRILVHVAHSSSEETRLDAQLRMGGDAGASEVILLHGYGELAEPTETLFSALLLPDAPIVAWWPHTVPPPSPHTSSIAGIAHRRIMDSARSDDAYETLAELRRRYVPGDTDLAWTRVTNWRIQLAAVLDQADPAPVREVVVEGCGRSPSVVLLGTWLGTRLDAEVTFVNNPGPRRLDRVTLVRDDGEIVLERPGRTVAWLRQPGQPDQQIAMPVRDLNACIAEELRRLDPDEVYGEVLTTGLRDVRVARILDTTGELAPGAARFLAEHGGGRADADQPVTPAGVDPADPGTAVPPSEPVAQAASTAPGEDRA